MRRIIIILMITAGLGTAFWWFNRPKPISVSLISVEVGKVEASVSNTRAGSVEACLRTRLSPISGGRIAYLGVKKGDSVKKGQVLLRLWNNDQQAQSRLAQTQVNSSQKRIAEVCAIADNAQREAERMAKLRAKNFISQGGEEKARYEATSRQAACD
ncbi:MAG TPA: efflux RND transporter periplasmic adaptor subunit, partial [Methylophilaceae bacterium]|nr:efflux RND transporter periplasmic adaptor subunit [Methylophilaceae bacterium]